jgi:8-amino-7-oxononanoate synthase
MVDFTSALYLGFRHAHNTLWPWAQFTTGRPAALEPAPEARRVARDLAELLLCERALIMPSTLHLYWDLFDLLATDRIAIYADAATYPVVGWGIERAVAKGVRTAVFRTHDPVALEDLLHRDRGLELRPVVVTDGLCPTNGQPAPLSEYLRLVRERDGYLVVDDTQALGILGQAPARDIPYGLGGAGTAAFHGIKGPELIMASSLAKGFGAPLAVIASNAGLIARFEDLSATRVHTSPPSLGAISAASRALAVNDKRGDGLRSHLVKLVRQFRDAMQQIGLSAQGGLFPVQTLRPIPGIDPAELHSRMLRLGVRAVLRSTQHLQGSALSFLITVMHTRSDISRCVGALRHSCTLLRLEQKARSQVEWNGSRYPCLVRARQSVGDWP